MSELIHIQDIQKDNVKLTGDLADKLVEGIGTNYALYIECDSSDTAIQYLGKAAIGSSGSDAVWQIREIDETTGTIITWADGNDNFDNVWDNRESLTYV